MENCFCGELVLQMETQPGDSEPVMLTVLNDELFFNARQDGQWGLWKSDSQQNIEFVQHGFFDGLTA